MTDIAAGLLTDGDSCTTSSDIAWREWCQCPSHHAAVGHGDLLSKLPGSRSVTSSEHCPSDWTDEQRPACSSAPAGEQ